MKEEDLKCCPFCLVEPIHINTITTSSSEKFTDPGHRKIEYEFYCTSWYCGAIVRFPCDDEERIIEKWNRREKVEYKKVKLRWIDLP